MLSIGLSILELSDMAWLIFLISQATNIWFFQPNMRFEIGKIGDGIHNTIVSAAKYLAALPWVDSTKMGLSGISFAGYQINSSGNSN